MTNTEHSRDARTKWLLAGAFLLVAIGVFLVTWVPYQRQLLLIEEIGAVGGSVATQQAGGWAWLRRMVGDQGMSGFDSVVGVRLNHAPIDDVWLKKLGRFSKLKWLALNNTQISDEGLKNLAGTTDLAGLYLDSTQISDDGLKHLAGITGLKSLWLSNTQVTDEAVKELQHALPNCNIVRSW